MALMMGFTSKPARMARGMRRVSIGLAALAICVVGLPAASAYSGDAAGQPSGSHNAGWVLSATDTSANYAPTFVGNGYLASRPGGRYRIQ
jgi:hypothetical protein